MVIAITADQMRQVDEIAIKNYGITLVQMMELAGFHLASLARNQMDGSVEDRKIVILVGKGHNGGDGIVAARHLHNWGGNVEVILSQEEGVKQALTKQLMTLRRLPVDLRSFQPQMKVSSQLSKASLILDALLGYGIRGNPRYPISELIIAANKSGKSILSLDLPSGLDATTGTRYFPCIQAHSTMTLALPKRGLMTTTVRDIVGELYLADIGIPSTLYYDIGLEIDNLFKEAPLLRIY